MDVDTRLTTDDCLHYGNNHATVRNMECSPTDSWRGAESCRACRCGRYQQHVDGCSLDAVDVVAETAALMAEFDAAADATRRAFGGGQSPGQENP